MNGLREKCGICQKEEGFAVFMRDWFWLKRGATGFWFCSFQCACASEMKFIKAEGQRWIPTKDEKERIGQ